LLGERLNEWRAARPRLHPTEFAVEALSDAEIHRLLVFLEQNGALGKLAELDSSLRYATVKNKHEKQLLVAMREVTEGKSFDAIIEDEYRSIASAFAQRAYGAVSGVYRLRHHVRDLVLAGALGVDLVDLYHEIGSDLEGVVRFDELDAQRGIYGARTRHQVIAQVLWERCIDETYRRELLLDTVQQLNLQYSWDLRAFDALIRDDDTVDGLGSFDAKTSFFETACKKQPDNAYVRQHYARMLLREGKPDLALGEIDQALDINPQPRALHHTKGMVLKELATTLASREIARRRLHQSEAEFLTGLSARDSYFFRSLADLYMGWARRPDTAPSEQAEYVAKAEEIISRGLRECRETESLLVASADIAQWVGDHPAALQALERAVEENPASILPRYLLGRMYQRDRRYQLAVDVLRPVIEQHSEEYRCALVYAKCQESLGEPLASAIGVLGLSTLYGYRDPYFIAMLGGMLTMTKQLGEAQNVFEESAKRAFTSEELHRVTYTPRATGGTGDARMTGTVTTVKASYAFVGVVGYPDFIWTGNSFGGLKVRSGLKIQFAPGFSARGCVVTRPVGID
jgi:tetratricopeptide (TPR) repeat protein